MLYNFYKQQKFIIFIILFLIGNNAKSTSDPGQHNEQVPFTMHTSNRVIKIDQSFKGARIVVFGTKPTTEDIAISLKGPTTSIQIKKEYQSSILDVFKKPIIKVKNVPRLYHIYSTSKINDIVNNDDSKSLNIRIADNNMEKYCLNCVQNEKDETEGAYQFLLKHLTENNILKEKENGNIVIDKTLYSGKFYLPVDTKEGIYSFTSYIGKNRKINQVKVMPMIIKKRGLSGKLFYLSRNDPHYYAILAIVCSILMGVFANIITTALFFRKKTTKEG
jgi:hypothetical protein